MITIAIEDIYASTILAFCENLAELGCPKNAEPDMWFRYLSHKEQLKVASKLIDIEERDRKRFEKEHKSNLKKIEKMSKEVHKQTEAKIKSIENAHKKTAKSKLRFGK